VIIPNRKIVGEILHNYGTIRLAALTVGVAYDTNVAEALSLIRDILKRNSRVLKDLPVGAGISALSDSAIDIAVSAWVAVADLGPAQAEIYLSILEEFRTRNIQMPFPQREVRILNGKEEEQPRRTVAA
jgi:small conductance mechanosensitive channel